MEFKRNISGVGLHHPRCTATYSNHFAVPIFLGARNGEWRYATLILFHKAGKYPDHLLHSGRKAP